MRPCSLPILMKISGSFWLIKCPQSTTTDLVRGLVPAIKALNTLSQHEKLSERSSEIDADLFYKNGCDNLLCFTLSRKGKRHRFSYTFRYDSLISWLNR